MTFCSSLFSDNVQSLLYEEVPVRLKRNISEKKKDVSASRGTLGVNAPRKAANTYSAPFRKSAAIGFHRQQMKSKEKRQLVKLSPRR